MGYYKTKNGIWCNDNYKVTPGYGELIPSANFGRYGIPNGVGLLPGPIEISGQIVEPFWRYGGNGTVASYPADVYGITLSTAGAGSDPLVNQGSPLLGSEDDSVKLEGGKGWQAALASTYDVTTEDLFFELVFKHNTDAIEYMMNKWAVSAGYWINTNAASDTLVCSLRGTGGSQSVVAAVSSISVGSWYYAAVVCDVSGSGQIYLMNTSSGASVILSAVGNLTSDGKFAWGILSNLTGFVTANLAYGAGYKKENWFDSHLQADFIKQRFSEIIGTKALSSRSKSVPVEASRVSTAYLQKDTKGISKLFHVGKNWTRIERVSDKNDVEKVCSNTESYTKNIARQSEDLTAWTPAGITIDPDNPSHPTPFEDKFFDGMIGSVGTSGKNISRSFVESTEVGRYVASTYVKKGNKQWLAIMINTATIGSRGRFFDLVNGVVGQNYGSGANAGIIDCKNGIYRIWITLDIDFAVESGYIYYILSNGDGDNQCTGDGVTVNTWGSHVQFEKGLVPTSYVGPVPIGSAVERAADDYQHDIGASSEIISNYAKHSEDINSWEIKARVLINENNPYQHAPVAGKYFDGMVATSINGTHAVQQRPIHWTTDIYCTSVFVKAGAKSWIHLYMQEAGAGNPNAYFHLTADGIVGTVGNCSAHIKYLAEFDCYLCWIINDIAYTASPYLTVYSAITDLSKTYTGDDTTVDTWVFGAQFRLGNKFDKYVGETTTLAKHESYKVKPGVLNQRIENKVLYSTAWDNPIWIQRGSFDAIDGATTGPKGNLDATQITFGANGVDDVIQVFAAGAFTNDVKLAVSIWIKAISSTGQLMIANPQTGTKGRWKIDLSVLYASGIWERIDRNHPAVIVLNEFVSSATGDAGLHIYEADGNTKQVYVWNPTQTQNRTYLTPSTDFPITTSSPTSLGESKGAMQFDLLIPDYGSIDPIPVIEVLELSRDGSAADRIRIFIATDKSIKVDIFATGGTSRRAAVIGNCADRIWHNVHIQWQVGKLIIRRDGITGTPVTTVIEADIPINLNRYIRGNARIANEQFFLQPYFPGV